MDQSALIPMPSMRDAYLQQRDARTGQGGQTSAAAMDEGYEPDLQDQGQCQAPVWKDLPSAQTLMEEGYEPPLEGGLMRLFNPLLLPASAGSKSRSPAKPLKCCLVFPVRLPTIGLQLQLFEKLSPGLGENSWKR